MKLATVCTRAGVDSNLAGQIFLRNVPLKRSVLPWAIEVVDGGQRWLLGQGMDRRFFVCFPLPFSGHADEWQVIMPMNSPEDFLKQIVRV